MDKHIKELLAFYALDASTEGDRELVEAYFAEHPELEQEINALTSVVAALPYSLSPVEPSNRPKKLLMERVSADRRARPSPQGQTSAPRGIVHQGILRGLPRAALAGLGMLRAAAAVLWVIAVNNEISRLRAEVAALRSEIQAQESSIEQVQAAVEQFRGELAQANQAALMTVELQGTPAQPQAHGQLIADFRSQSALLVVSGLAPLQPGSIYQVWLIRGETPTSVGLFEVNAHGQGALMLTSEKAIGTFDALGISIEPEMGSLQPTGDIVILSQLS